MVMKKFLVGQLGKYSIPYLVFKLHKKYLRKPDFFCSANFIIRTEYENNYTGRKSVARTPKTQKIESFATIDNGYGAFYKYRKRLRVVKYYHKTLYTRVIYCCFPSQMLARLLPTPTGNHRETSCPLPYKFYMWNYTYLLTTENPYFFYDLCKKSILQCWGTIVKAQESCPYIVIVTRQVRIHSRPLF